MKGSRLRCLCVALAVTTGPLSACSSTGNSGQSCHPPNLDGSVFGGTGSATLIGAGTLPDGIPDGLELEVLVKTDIVSVGVLPDSFPGDDRICGKKFHYTVKKLAAGTYTLTFEVFDPNSTTVMSIFEGTAPSDFTIADGQTLALDTTFQLSAK